MRRLVDNDAVTGREELGSVAPQTIKTFAAVISLLTLLLLAFSPAIFGGKTLLLSSWDAPSVLSAGAYDQSARPPLRLQRTSDPGAPAWQTEPWFALIGGQLWGEHNWPLWNPYNAFGTPLAAAQQPQPFFPLAALLSLDVTPLTYSLFIVGRLFIAGLLMFLFAGMFLSGLPALFAAVAFSLSGYFIVFLNMPHLSAEVLTPGMLLAFELLLRRNSWSAVALSAAMILLGMTAGMPESFFLTMAFASLYFVSRLLFAPAFRAQAGVRLAKFVTAIVLGFALSAFLLLPFLEFLRLGHDVHQLSNMAGVRTGLIADSDYRSVVQYLLPLVFGPILNSVFQNFSGFTGLKGYWGIVPFFFAMLALSSFICRNRPPQGDQRNFLTAFFAAVLAAMLLKRFGNIALNWIGYLPVSELVLYPKYLEPLLGLCVAMLAGIGLSLLIERRILPRILMLVGASLLALMLALAAAFIPALRGPDVRYPIFFYLSVAAGVLAVTGIVLLAWLATRSSGPRRIWLMRSLVAALSLELLFNFLIPSFYLLSRLPPATANPYAGAPYVDFLKARNLDHARVFGREKELYPNWSAAFGIADVRSVDAVLYVRYRDFVRNFLLPPSSPTRVNGDLADRFSGQDFAYSFDSELERRFLALSSVRYLLTDSDYGFPTAVVDEIVRQHQDESIWGFGVDIFPVDGVRMRGMFQHAPSTRVAYRVTVPADAPAFEGIAALKASAAEASKSDGVGFHLAVKDGDRSETLFETFLDPNGVPGDRSGRAFHVDLARYAGRNIEFVFSTDPGPKGDSTGDWAGWAGLRFVARDAAAPATPFRKIYDAELRIYEVPSVLPRAALYRAIELLPDAGVLERLKQTDFDPRERAVVSRESLPADAMGLAQLAQGPAVPVSAASITRYESQYVRIEADAAEPALLVLNDANYPGWQAYLNGAEVPTVAANYLFRGVLLPVGKNTVEFRYQPMSFRAGSVISVVAFLTLAGLVFHERRKRRVQG